MMKTASPFSKIKSVEVAKDIKESVPNDYVRYLVVLNLSIGEKILVDEIGESSQRGGIREMKNLGKKINPDYTLLVMTADIGQAAKKQASEFQKALSINGVIITRMDSTAKGGGALTACSETKAPVFFITTGEHIHDIESFDPLYL